MPSGVGTHYQPFLLVCCITRGHAFLCGAPLSAMHVSVVPHYRPCLLAWYLTICYACRSIGTATDILLVKRRWKKDGYESDATCTEVSLYQACQLIRCHFQICLLVQCNSVIHASSFIQIRMFVKCCSIRHGIWSVTNPSDMPTGRVPLPWFCKTCLLPS